MERAPPPPPSSNERKTPRLYMTPHMAKRKDGLCPSLLQFYGKHQTPYLEKPGHIVKTYQTNSNLLRQIRVPNGLSRAAVELQTIIEVIHRTLRALSSSSSRNSDDPSEQKKKQLIASVQFNPEGCIWKLAFHSSLGHRADESHCMEFVCCANSALSGEETKVATAAETKNSDDQSYCSSDDGNIDDNGFVPTNYLIKSTLILIVPPLALELLDDKCCPPPPTTLAPPVLDGYKEAKAAFEFVTVAVRKSVVRLEFPDFPHGGKTALFREIYQLNARIKSGAFATVCRGTHRQSGRNVAVKCILRKDLPPADDAAIYDEVAILAGLQHPHIVPILDFFDEKDCYFIVMEHMAGGDLFDRIGKKKSYSEADARDLVVKMLKAVAICHQKNIAHCDMKPKNLLLVSEEDDSYIKLADFGFAARVHQPKSLTKQCGTPFFVAPEILTRRPYDQQSDMWSVGCIVFLLLSGGLPFVGRNQKELFRCIVSGKFEFKEESWKWVSDDAKDMVTKLLTLNPDKRITAKKALLHPWLKVSADRLTKNGLLSTSQRLKTFNAKMKLRSVMIAVDTISLLQRMGGMQLSARRGSTGSVSPSSSSSSSSTSSLQMRRSSLSSMKSTTTLTSTCARSSSRKLSSSEQKKRLSRRVNTTTSKDEGMITL